MLRDIDTTLLRAFTAVVETGSVTAAARMLNRTQSAISLQIKRLEDLLAVELFEREHRKLTLTPAGERLVGPAIRLVGLNDEIWGQMTTPEFDGEVRFGVPTDIVPTYIPTILRRYNRAWPQVRVTLTLGNSQHILEMLAEGDIDLALTTDAEPVRNAEMLRVDTLVFVGAPHGRAHLQSPLPLAIGDGSCRFRPVVLEALREAKRSWRLVLEVSHQVAQEATVSAGIAISAALSDSVPLFLQVLGPESGLPELPQFMINMHMGASAGSPTVKALADHVRAEFQGRSKTADRLLDAPVSSLPQRAPEKRRGLSLRTGS
ncbi:MAG: LysR family transcriptional regulator [Hyphomicrobiaceae bacterium]|nr:LysR family transcriptional regulator [Hyphomicrobiaceae bacterium]